MKISVGESNDYEFNTSGYSSNRPSKGLGANLSRNHQFLTVLGVTRWERIQDSNLLQETHLNELISINVKVRQLRT